MRIPSVKTFLLGLSLVLVTALPAAAQTLGAGLSFLEGHLGATVDYSKPFRTLSSGRPLGWVGDFSFHRQGSDNDLVGVDASATFLTFQGGIRLQGTDSEKIKWHVQGLVGILRTSVNLSASGLTEEICDQFDLDCEAGASDTGVIVTPGVGVDYVLNPKRSVRAQFDLPIGEGGSTWRFWVGLSMTLDY